MTNNSLSQSFREIKLLPIFHEGCDNNQYYLEIRGFWTKEDANKIKEKIEGILKNG